MGRKCTPGLYKRNGVWHIDKQVRGCRLCESTGTRYLKEAEAYLARRIEQIRQASIYGVRQKRTFREAATRYLNEATKSTLADDGRHLQLLDPYIGDLDLTQVHMGILQPFVRARRSQGIKTSSVLFCRVCFGCAMRLAISGWIATGLTRT